MTGEFRIPFVFICLTLDQSFFLIVTFSIYKMGIIVHVFRGVCEDQRWCRLFTKYVDMSTKWICSPLGDAVWSISELLLCNRPSQT